MRLKKKKKKEKENRRRVYIFFITVNFFLFTVPHEDERCCCFEGKEGRVNMEWDKQFTQLKGIYGEIGVLDAYGNWQVGIMM